MLIEMDRCPFCGKHGQKELMCEAALPNFWHVVCHPCGATGPIAKTPDEAVALWNERRDIERYGMGLMVEEMGEALQAIGQGLRFGLDTPNGEGQAGREKLAFELGDVRASISWAERARIVDDFVIEDRGRLKLGILLSPASRDNLGRRLAPDLARRG